MLFVKDMSSPVCATIHLLLQGLNAVVLLLAIVVTSLVMSASFGTYPNQGFPSNITFMTTTFYSARTMDLGYGWPVATERQEIGVTITNPTKASAWAWDHYYECMYSARLGDAQCNPANSGNPTGYVSCLTTNNVTQSALGNCSIFSNTYYTQWPTQSQYIRCVTSNPALASVSLGAAAAPAFDQCVKQSMWPFFEIQQSPTSSIFLGSFNWGILLSAGLAIFTSFSVYTASPWTQGPLSNGLPHYSKLLGMIWSGIACAWHFSLFFAFLYYFLHYNPVYYLSSTTCILSLGGLGIFFLYFLCEVLESSELTDHRLLRIKRRGHMAISVLDPDPSFTIDSNNMASRYTEPLLAVWSDAYFSDPLIFLGIAGSTQQLTTHTAWNLLTLLFLYRLLNSILARFLFECFAQNPFEEEETTAYKQLTPLIKTPSFQKTKGHTDPSDTENKNQAIELTFDLKVMSLSTQIASIYLFVALIMLTQDPNQILMQSSTFSLTFWLCFVVPESLRFILHLVCQLSYQSNNDWLILVCYQFLFIWDLATRVILGLIAVFGMNQFYGQKPWLDSQVTALMQTFPPLYSLI